MNCKLNIRVLRTEFSKIFSEHANIFAQKVYNVLNNQICCIKIFKLVSLLLALIQF